MCGWPLEICRREEIRTGPSLLGLKSCPACLVNIEKIMEINIILWKLIAVERHHHHHITTVVFSMNIWFHSKTQLECPTLPPLRGHHCVPRAGALDCHYRHYTSDHCCCGNCPDSFTLSCVPDSITGAGFWQSTLCPAEGCGSEGEWRWKLTKCFFFHRCCHLAEPPWQLP